MNSVEEKQAFRTKNCSSKIVVREKERETDIEMSVCLCFGGTQAYEEKNIKRGHLYGL